MNNKTLIILGLTGVLISCVPSTTVKATDTDVQQSYSDEIQPRADGLIKRYEIYVSESNGNLCINGSTVSSSEMKSIGFKDISIEYSSDKVNWHEEKSLDDMLNSNSISYYLSNYAVSVKGGYYYRVSCTHYAKAKGLFGGSQSENNTSNSVWISK